MTAVSTYTGRVAARAAEIQPSRVALSVIAAPFFLIGLLVGAVVAVFLWGFAGVAEGFRTVVPERGSRT